METTLGAFYDHFFKNPLRKNITPHCHKCLHIIFRGIGFLLIHSVSNMFSEQLNKLKFYFGIPEPSKISNIAKLTKKLTFNVVFKNSQSIGNQ